MNKVEEAGRIELPVSGFADRRRTVWLRLKKMVDPARIELATPCLQGRRSPK